MFWERCYISCQFWGKITIGFRSILVVNSEKKITICFGSVNFSVM